jgi:flavodoxin
MSQILVTYFSRTGNTRAVAQAIHEALPAAEIRPLREAGPLKGYDLVFLGFPVERHSIPFPVDEAIRSIPAGSPIALFSTHGSLQDHRLSREALEYAAVISAGAKLLGTFHCRGRLSLRALDELAKTPEHEEWTGMAASAATHPDAADLEEARAFARRIEMLAAHGGY